MNKFLTIALFLLFLLPTSIFAIGISPASISMDFTPGHKESFEFHTEKRSDVDVQVEGALAEYLTIEENNIATEGTFIITLELPETIDTPGVNKAFVRLIEKGKGGGMVSGIASIRTPITVRVPFDGMYADLSFSIGNVNINETTNAILSVYNKGTEDIESIRGLVDIFDHEDKKVDALTIEGDIIPAQSSRTFTAEFNASKHKAGTYSARVDVHYGENVKQFGDSFRIGTLTINIINYTQQFYKNTIDKFDIKLESGWNDPIRDIFVDVSIANGSGVVSNFKTVSFDLDPWDKKTISTFWDSNDFAYGQYDLTLLLKYQGEVQEEKGTLVVTTPPYKESTFSFKKYLNMTTVFAIAVFVLIAINLYLLVRRRRE